MTRDQQREIGSWFAWVIIMAYVGSRFGASAHSFGVGVGIFATMVLVAPLNSVIHEAGHVLAAKAVGFRVLKAEIGRGAPWLTVRWGGLDLWVRRYLFIGGRTTYLRSNRSRWRQAVTTLGGVCANFAALVAVAIGGLALWPSVPEAAQGVARACILGLILSNAWDVAHNLLPSRGEGDEPDSDGAQLIDVLREKPGGFPKVEGVPEWLVEALLLDQGRCYVEALAIYERQFAKTPNSPELLSSILHLTLHLYGGDMAVERYATAVAARGEDGWDEGSESSRAWLDANVAWAMLHADRPVDLDDVERLVERALAHDPLAHDPLAHDPEALALRATRAALGVRRGHVEPGEVVLFDAIRRTQTPVDRAAFGRFLAREATRRDDDSADDYRRMSADLDRAVA